MEGWKKEATDFFSMLPRTNRCASPGTSGEFSLLEGMVCSKPGVNVSEGSEVGGPLPPEDKDKSGLALFNRPGEAIEPERLRDAAMPSRAEARDEEPII